MAATQSNTSLTSFAWLSIAAALVTIALKTVAWQVTDSVGLLSDALESVVNLIAAIGALIALNVAAREPDEEHAYGHGKAEYFSSGFEGGLIFLAAIGIFYSAIPRLINPQPLGDVGIGLVVALVASVINGLVGMRLMRAAREYRSVTLDADARHLFTDVWTSVGVVLGIVVMAVTGWHRLDAILAIAVGVNVLLTGYQLVDRSIHGLLDTAISSRDFEALQTVLDRWQKDHGILTHALRTRQAGRRRFVSMHVLVPGHWTVDHGHDVVGEIERDVRQVLPDTTVFTHLEPLENPVSWDDTGLDG
jgi:cation diffusion facilitator family transporter